MEVPFFFLGSTGNVPDTVMVTKSTFDNDNAEFGGALYTEGIAYADVQACTFCNNIAYQGVGGAMYSNGYYQRYTSVLLANSAFIHNSAPADVNNGKVLGNDLDSLALQTSCSKVEACI